MRRRRELPAHLRHRPFATAEARAAGLDSRRLAADDVVSPFRGVHVPVEVGLGVRARAWAAAVLFGPGTLIAEFTALQILGRQVSRGLDSDGPIHVIPPRRVGQADRDGLVIHWRKPGLFEPLDRLSEPRLAGCPFAVQHPADAWAQLAARVSDRTAIVAGDTLLKLEDHIAAMAHLSILAERATGRGTARVRRVVPSIRAGTESVWESELRLLIVAAGLPCPLVNEEVFDNGRFVARPDLSYPAWRIAIEYDGDQHRTDKAQWRRDIQRRERLRVLGWQIVTAVAPDILGDSGDFLLRLRRVVAERRG